MFLKKLAFIFLIGFFGIVSVNSVSVSDVDECPLEPDNISIQTGNYFLGDVAEETDRIYILPNIGDDNLEFEVIFRHTQEECFSSEDDVSFRLHDQSAGVEPDSYDTESMLDGAYYESTYVFNIDTQYILSEPLNSYLDIENMEFDDSLQWTFEPDDSAPNLEVELSDLVTSGDEEITLSYSAEDSYSGVDIVSVDGDRDDFGGDSSVSGERNFTPTSDTEYTIRAYDMLGNNVEERVNVVVYDSGAQINDFRETGYNSDRDVSFSAEFEHEILEEDDFSLQDIDVRGDFTSINSNLDEVSPNSCEYTGQNDRSFECEWGYQQVSDLDETDTVSFDIEVEDSLGNVESRSFSEEIISDDSPPEIEEFYLESNSGVENVLSARSGATVHLEVTHHTIEDLVVIEDFFGIDFEELSSECQEGEESYSCHWQLTPDILTGLQGIEEDTLDYGIEVEDIYGEIATEEIEVDLNNVEPEITNISIEEEGDIQDGVIQTGEEISIRAEINGSTVSTTHTEVYGNLSSISYGEYRVEPECGSYGDDSIECYFNDVEVENGYFERNITVFATDDAGNKVDKDKKIEVLGVDGEPRNLYRILPPGYEEGDNENLSIINPINRNILESGTATAYFEGDIKLQEDDGENIELLDYSLIGCDKEAGGSIPILDARIYPDEEFIEYGQDNFENFAMTVELGRHEDFVDMQEFSIECEMSVVKRNDTYIYTEPEEVSFGVDIEFFDEERGALQKAHAENIIEAYEDDRGLATFYTAPEDDGLEDIYDYYEALDQFCRGFNQIGQALSTASNVWTGVSITLRATGYGTAIAEPGDQLTYESQSLASVWVFDEDSFISQMCNWVTCRPGGTLLDLLAGDEGMIDRYSGAQALRESFGAWCGGLGEDEIDDISESNVEEAQEQRSRDAEERAQDEEDELNEVGGPGFCNQAPDHPRC